MKKKALLVAALAAVMSLGSAVVSQAAGWTIEGGAWVYLDTDGYRVYNEWRRGADNQWRYLDGYGQMALNAWVDDEYYVDENGIMVTGGWKQLDISPAGDTDDIHWYYFQENGKVVTDRWLKISGKWYHFDSEGIMETGWLDDDMYFCGDDGAALTGWQKLEPPEGDDAWWDVFASDDGRYWYYFNTSGKKYVPTGDAEYTEKRIDGVYYCFNRTGIMQTGWVPFDGSASIGEYRYYSSSGACVTGWYTAEPPEELAGGYESDVDWFYFSKNGSPKVGPAEGTATSSDFVKINGKTYLFNDKGNPVTGLQRIAVGDGEYTAYYFNEDDRTAAKGKMKLEEYGDGVEATYYFNSYGKGYTGVYSGSLYYMGKLQKAEDGLRYEAIEVNGSSYLVNEAGRVTKSTTGVKDADGIKYTTDKTGLVTKINDQVVGSDAGRSPDEPQWWY